MWSDKNLRPPSALLLLLLQLVLAISSWRALQKNEWLIHNVQKQQKNATGIPLYVHKASLAVGGPPWISPVCSFILLQFTFHLTCTHNTFKFSYEISDWIKPEKLKVLCLSYHEDSAAGFVHNPSELHCGVHPPKTWKSDSNSEMIFRLCYAKILVSIHLGNRLAIYLDSIPHFAVSTLRLITMKRRNVHRLILICKCGHRRINRVSRMR